MSSKRILYITDTRAIGGAERYLADLAEQAARSGHQVLVLCPQQDVVDWLEHEAPSASVARAFVDDYHDAPTPLHRGVALGKLLVRLTRALHKLAPEVVHINNGGFPGSDLCRIALPAARLAGVPIRLMTVHSNPWPRDHAGLPLLQVSVDHLIWSSVHLVIAPSEAVAGGLRVRRGMPGGLGQTIYYGVPPVPHDARSVARLRARLAPSGGLLAGMVSARPVPEKGYGVFLEALAAAGERVSGVVVGPPPEELAAQVRALGLEGRLAIEGPRESLGSYYAAFDVLVVPSTAGECMPLVILEAASAGTATFASRLSGIPEAICDGREGRLFEPGAADALAALLNAAERDRARTLAMGRAAHERWRTQFQCEEMLRATLDLYEGRDDGGAVSGTR